jgi:REP element-mobilizing transposase RayT
MAKKLRLKGCELYHHIYNRGNDRHPIFKDPSDYKRYLEYLKKYSEAYGIDIIAYALMEWHIHLFILDAIVFNRCYGRIGHVFGSRFKNSIVDADNYAIWLSRYIHRQAVEAGFVNKPEDYEWTSYQNYISKEAKSVVKPEIVLSQFKNASDDSRIAYAYEEFVNCNDDGPINWRETEQSSRSIIGNRSYIEKVNTKWGMINVPESSVEKPLVTYVSV